MESRMVFFIAQMVNPISSPNRAWQDAKTSLREALHRLQVLENLVLLHLIRLLEHWKHGRVTVESMQFMSWFRSGHKQTKQMVTKWCFTWGYMNHEPYFEWFSDWWNKNWLTELFCIFLSDGLWDVGRNDFERVGKLYKSKWCRHHGGFISNWS